MDDADEIAVARNEAFRRIGRNVYFFQKFEAILKELLIYSDVQGYAVDLQSIVATRAKDVENLSLGKLVEAFARSVYSDRPIPDRTPTEITNIWVSTSIRVEADKSTLAERRKVLRLVVKQRNSLVHQMLVNLDTNSIDELRGLHSFLDAQRQTIIDEFESLRSLKKALFDATNQQVEAPSQTMRETAESAEGRSQPVLE